MGRDNSRPFRLFLWLLCVVRISPKHILTMGAEIP